MQQTTKKLFIGSSSNALKIAKEVKQIISENFRDIEIKIWNETEWKNLTSILDNLKNSVDEYYYAIFIGFPDDKITSGGNSFFTTRDNVIFEFGLFLSRLDKNRVFLLIPQLSSMDSPFKILSDIGESVIFDKYKLVREGDNWITQNISNDLQKLIQKIRTEEKRLQSLDLGSSKKIKNLESELTNSLEKEGMSDEYYIGLFINKFDELVRLLSNATNRKINETIEDALIFMTSIEDVLNTKQLAEKQSYDKITEVWVFADQPLEFLANRLELKELQNTIVTNLERGVVYHYFVDNSFDESIVAKFLKNNNNLIKNIYIHKIDQKYFKTYFTLHFFGNKELSDIYLSALMQYRKDVLIKVSQDHQQRIYNRIERIIGQSKSVNGVEIKNYT